jgi:hypothetical protein
MFWKKTVSFAAERTQRGGEFMSWSIDTIILLVIAVELALVLAKMGTKKG